MIRKQAHVELSKLTLELVAACLWGVANHGHCAGLERDSASPCSHEAWSRSTRVGFLGKDSVLLVALCREVGGQGLQLWRVVLTHSLGELHHSGLPRVDKWPH